MKKSDPVLDHEIVYVTTQGTQVGIENGRLVIRVVSENAVETTAVDTIGDSVASFPLDPVETVNVFGKGVDVTSGVRCVAGDEGIAINYFGANGQYRGSFAPRASTIATVRRQQYGLSDTRCQALARDIVSGKCYNGTQLLMRRELDVPDELAHAGMKVEQANSLNEIRGVEGEAARAYFNVFDSALPAAWTFDRRTHNPPEDHINSLLSLLYTLVQNEVESALRQVNLDPYLGILHADRHGRPSLALDLLEEFRHSIADPLTTGLLNRGTITHNDFTTENRLTDDAFDRLIGKWDNFLTAETYSTNFDRSVERRRVIRGQAVLLRKTMTGELSEYHPYRLGAQS